MKFFVRAIDGECLLTYNLSTKFNSIDMENAELAIFEDYNIRRKYHQEREKWYFSIVDIIKVLIQQKDFQVSRKYWNKLKERLRNEGSQSVTLCHQLKLKAADGKKYLTDVADVETLLRLIQSIPSPKAEPVKLWLAKVGYERMQEMIDPEKSLNRARENWKKYGRSGQWIQQRMMGQEIRNKLTDYWGNHEVKTGKEFAILTNIIHQEWAELSVKDHKKLKNLKDQNLRDHMSDAELVFTALAELSTRQIAESTKATGLEENEIAGREGGGISKRAKLELEERSGKKVITNQNYLKKSDIKQLDK